MMDDETIGTVYIEEETYGGEQTDAATFKYIEENPGVLAFAGPLGKKDADRFMAVAASQEKTAVATFDWVRTLKCIHYYVSLVYYNT